MMKELAIKGVFLNTHTQRNVLLLSHKADAQILPIWLDTPEASTISMILEGETPPKPVTHDFILDIILALGGFLEKIELYAMQGEEIFARAILMTILEERIAIECRPVDAIAIAIRSKAPIWCADEVLESGIRGASKNNLADLSIDADNLEPGSNSFNSAAVNAGATESATATANQNDSASQLKTPAISFKIENITGLSTPKVRVTSAQVINTKNEPNPNIRIAVARPVGANEMEILDHIEIPIEEMPLPLQQLVEGMSAELAKKSVKKHPGMEKAETWEDILRRMEPETSRKM